MDCESYSPTMTSTPFDDFKRYMENVRHQGIKPFEVRIPADFYARLTPEQIAWAENEFQCKLRAVKPVVFKLYKKLEMPMEGIFKTSSPKEYGMSLRKRRKR